MDLMVIFNPTGACSWFKNSYINPRCKYVHTSQEGRQKKSDQGNVWTFRDWTEAPRLLKVSCLICTNWELSHFPKSENQRHPCRCGCAVCHAPGLVLSCDSFYSLLLGESLCFVTLCGGSKKPTLFLPRGHLKEGDRRRFPALWGSVAQKMKRGESPERLITLF